MTSIIFKLATIFFKIINPGLTVASGVKIDPRAFPARGGRIAIGANSIIRAGTMLLPGGGSIEKPIGTIWIGVSSASQTFAKKYHMSGNRIQVKERFSQTALWHLLEILSQE